MKAIVFDAPGAADVLRWDEVPTPTPQDGEVLVRVRATAINRADILQRRGGYAPPPGASPILGLEVAGEVVEAAGTLKVGDRVMAVVTGGGYAEYAAFPAELAMPVPPSFSWEQAAAVPEVFQTAWLNALMLGRLQAGETALIHAGASGVGTAAIQLVKAIGARAIATVGSAEKCAACLALGAEVALNYREAPFAPRVLAATDGRGADVILDFVGAPNWEANLSCIAPFGRLMLIGFLGSAVGELSLAPILAKSLTVTGTTLRRTPLPTKIRLAREVSDFSLPRFESGVLKPVIDCVLPITQAAQGHQRMEANLNTGKIVLTVP